MASHIERRKFLATLGGAAVAWPLAARAQQQRAIPRIGLVSIGADPANPVIFVPFLQQFRELGYIEGQNVISRNASQLVRLTSSAVSLPIWSIEKWTSSSRPGSGKPKPLEK
jgi:hypothetical protein